ncbi:MAG: protein kinase [Planctomycetes bacterium]|nr:protein kinase [Planctomycetota bacterium]
MLLEQRVHGRRVTRGGALDERTLGDLVARLHLVVVPRVLHAPESYPASCAMPRRPSHDRTTAIGRAGARASPDLPARTTSGVRFACRLPDRPPCRTLDALARTPSEGDRRPTRPPRLATPPPGCQPVPDASLPPTPDEIERLDELVAEALLVLESDGMSALEAHLAPMPEASVVRARLAALHAAGLVPSADGTGHGTIPERLGDFTLLARLGGGGMGVVYLARQESLGRRVALKLVRPELLYFSGARERFAREVAAVARLADPGIVPIYSVGEEHGVPYFAMELVHGATLAEIAEAFFGRDPSTLTGADLQAEVERLARRHAEQAGDDDPVARGAPGADIEGGASPRVGTRSSGVRGRAGVRSSGVRAGAGRSLFAGGWVASCLRIAARVATALQHAHERGVLHRDVKPSNILVTPDGRVLLFDFGLASSDGSQRITRTGLRLGSVAYMPPEQLDGRADEIDERSDVYALGVSLYELLTLRLPFAQADGEALASAIRAGRPRAPREHNAAVTRDGETVLLTAMDSDRARRYASAAAFADDLGNVLELRPVAARRPGVALRARRFTQRHPAAATALVLGLLLLVGGPVTWAVQAQRAARAEGAQRERAERNLQRALQAVDGLLLQVGDTRLADVPQLGPLRRDLLTDARRLFEELASDNPDDPALVLSAMRSGNRLGLLLAEQGDFAASRAAYERVLALGDPRLAASPDDLDLLLMSGSALGGLEGVARGLTDEALLRDVVARAEDVARHAVEVHPTARDAWSMLAAMLGKRASLLESDGDLEAASGAWLEAVAVQDRVLEADPEDVAQIAQSSLLINNCASLLVTVGRGDEARPLLERGIALDERRLERAPDDRRAALALVALHTNLARILVQQGRPDDAVDMLRQAARDGREGHERFPDDVEIARQFVGAGRNLASTLASLGDQQEAAQILDEVVRVQQDLVGRMPDSSQAWADLGIACNNLGAALRALGRADDSRAPLERGVEAVGRALQISDQVPQGAALARTLHQHLAKTQLEAADLPGVERTAESLARMLPDDGDAQRIAASFLSVALALLDVDASLSPETREGRAAALAARAVELLNAARLRGAFSDADLLGARDFGPLRNRPEIGALVAGSGTPGVP